ncbi:TetR family transcriptional regulator [Streptomyces sp. Li-HN-5-11]|uniref:TetR family transcriptional regulator n=1 Tax=Streptomyces sp. Li-HN-5-11 TaxID=3075432 RepID=UPI0028B1BE12|nr:TetR family transcriptional regulator [Streptomyces sp. Li-HN-5-11]WNM30923.1 TetR family transcriptional regulator [Streptomyces sp. Li-HN-5-11]
MTDSSRPSTQPAAKPPGLRERMRATVRKEVVEAATRLFNEQGFDKTTVDQIAAEVGISRASLFRYFGTKEDIVLGGLEDVGRRLAHELAARPEDEHPWEALRRAFELIVQFHEEAGEQALRWLRTFKETPSLRARNYEKQLSWQGMLVPEIARRLAVSPDEPTEVTPLALVASALACLDVALTAWVACEGAVRPGELLDRAMSALTE